MDKIKLPSLAEAQAQVEVTEAELDALKGSTAFQRAVDMAILRAEGDLAHRIDHMENCDSLPADFLSTTHRMQRVYAAKLVLDAIKQVRLTHYYTADRTAWAWMLDENVA